MPKTTEDREVQIIMRVPSSVRERIDAHLERMRQAMPGTKPSLNEACLNLVLSALDAAESKREGRR